MKKKIAVITMVVLVITLVLSLSSCNKEEEVKIDKITIEYNKDNPYKKGSAFSTSDFTVTAHLSDDTTKEIQNNLIWHTDVLELDDEGKFTKSGKFELKVDFLKYKDISITITVND